MTKKRKFKTVDLPPLQHATRLKIPNFSTHRFSDDDALSLLASEGCEPAGGGASPPASLDDEAESRYEVVPWEEVAGTLGVLHLNSSERAHYFDDLSPNAVAAFRKVEAPTVEDLATSRGGSWGRALGELLQGGEPPYRLCRASGRSYTYFLQATRDIDVHEPMGVLVGRLIEHRKWKMELKEARADGRSSAAATRCWDISREELRKASGEAVDEDGDDSSSDEEDEGGGQKCGGGKHQQRQRENILGSSGEAAPGAAGFSVLGIQESGDTVFLDSCSDTVYLSGQESGSDGWEAAVSSRAAEKEAEEDGTKGFYQGPALVVDLGSMGNELLHLHDPFWEGSDEHANTQIFTTFVKHRVSGIAWPTSLLLATRPIKAKETLKIDWPDEWWEELTMEKNMNAARTAWGSLHFPLLQLRDLAMEYGVDVAKTAPYFEEELEEARAKARKRKEEERAEEERERARREERRRKREETSAADAAAAAEGSSEKASHQRAVSESTSSCIGTYTGAVVVDDTSVQRRSSAFTGMHMNAAGSWFLDDGAKLRRIVRGPLPAGPEKEATGPTKEAAFEVISEESLRQMPFYSTEFDFSGVPRPLMRRMRRLAATAPPLSKAEKVCIDTGECPKVEVTEIVSLRHPVRFLTAPNRRAYGVNMKPGCLLKMGEAIGTYAGRVTTEEAFAESADAQKQLYVYSMTPKNLAKACRAGREARGALTTLLVDAAMQGNAMRFLNDKHGRKTGANIVADCVVDPRTGRPYMMLRWNARRNPMRGEELIVDYGGLKYWKVAGRALHMELKRHAEVAYVALERLKEALRGRGVAEEHIAACAAPVDPSTIYFYERELGVPGKMAKKKDVEEDAEDRLA